MAIKINKEKGPWLAQLEENMTLDLGVVRSNPTLDVDITEKINK